MFVEAHGSFLPVELKDMRAFLELYMSNGRENLNKTKYASFLDSFLDVAASCNHSDSLRKITSATLLSTYLLSQFILADNHVSLCEGWAILIAYILRYASFRDLASDDFAGTVSLIQESIDEQLRRLKAEVLEKKGNFIEGNPMGDGGLMYPVRQTIVLGWLAAYDLVRCRVDSALSVDRDLLGMIEENEKYLGIWGEYAAPFMAIISSLYRRSGQKDRADRLLGDMLRTIVVVNNVGREAGFPDPYCGPDELLSSFYEMPGKEIDLRRFAGSCYTGRAFVDALVHFGRRDLLAPMWEHVSTTRFVEYYPVDSRDMLLWRSEKGQELDFGYSTPTKWSELLEHLPDKASIAQPLVERPEFLPYFVLTFPHRFRRDLFVELLRKYVG
jgi:hypothetical protein